MHWIKDIYSVLYVYIYPVNNVLVLLLSRLVKDGFISYQLGDLSVSSPHKHLLHKTFLTTPDSIPFSEVNALLNNEMIAQYTMCFHTFYIWLTIKKWLVKFQSEILYQHEWLNNITRVFNAAEWTHFQC